MGSIALVDIDQELKRQWDEAQGENKIRASLFNLIIYAKKNRRAEHYKELVKAVVSHFPCRIILVISDGAKGEEYLETSVSAETIGNEIFCEIITIKAAGSLRERTYFLLLPHLLCDLPIYLLWTKDPTEKSLLLPHLEKIASRIIFDSEESSNITEYAQTILTLLKRVRCEIGDLNWSALSGWRKAITAFFNSPSSYQQLLMSKKIEICYVNDPTLEQHHHEIEAAYLHSWLAALLHWTFLSIEHSEGHLRLSYQTASGECVFYLIGQKSTFLSPGAIISLKIESLEKKATTSFVRQDKTHQLCITYSDQKRCDLPYYGYLSCMEEGKEIIEELFYPSGRKHYQQMLENLSHITWSI